MVFAIHGYPLLGGDSYSFLPSSIHLARGEGLINELYMPTGEKEVLFYPPLFAYFQSLLYFGNHANSVFISIAITAIISLAIFLWILKRELHYIPFSFYKISLVLLITLGLCTGLDFSSGRPEILINLLLCIALLIHVINSRYANYYFGALLALIVLCSIVTGVYAFIILAMYYVYTKRKISDYLNTIISSAVIFSVFLLLYPYSLLELINTMYLVAQKIVFIRDDAFTWTEFIKYHITYPSFTFYFLLFTISIVLVVKSIFNSPMLLVLLSLLLLLIYYFGIRNLATNYYVYNLFIVYLFIVVVHLNSIKNFKYLACVLFFLLSIGFIRRTFLFVYFFDKSATIIAVGNELSKYKVLNFSKSTSFWIFEYYQPENKQNSTTYLLYQQAFAQGKQSDYKNVEIDKTRAGSLKLGKLVIANNPPFYYYSLVKND